MAIVEQPIVQGTDFTVSLRRDDALDLWIGFQVETQNRPITIRFGLEGAPVRSRTINPPGGRFDLPAAIGVASSPNRAGGTAWRPALPYFIEVE